MTPGVDRRRFLALAGGAALSTPLAGCTDRLPLMGPERIDDARLRELAEREPPSIPETLPVDIEPSFVAAQAAEARAVLATVPAPFGERDIPNGAIRERLNERHDRAAEEVASIQDGATPWERLQRAGHARGPARGVWGAWRAISDDWTVTAAEAEADGARTALDAFVAGWSYLGDDPVRAVRVHAALERSVREARNRTSFAENELARARGRPFAVGRVTEQVESGRVAVAHASYLYDRHRERLADGTAIRSRLQRARDTLGERFSDGTEGVPDLGRDVDDDPADLVDRGVGETAGVWALGELYDGVRRWERTLEDPHSDEPGLATGVLDATRALVTVRAFHRLRDRIEDGDDVAIDAAQDVLDLRAGAAAAAETARDGDGQALAAELLPQYADYIGYVDRDFRYAGDEPSVPVVARDASEYVVVSELCGALPAVTAEVEAVLRES